MTASLKPCPSCKSTDRDIVCNDCGWHENGVPRAPEWRPISEAPRDGTKFDVLLTGVEGLRRRVADVYFKHCTRLCLLDETLPLWIINERGWVILYMDAPALPEAPKESDK